MDQIKRKTSGRITRTKVAPNSHLLPRHDQTESSKAEIMEEPTLLRVGKPEQSSRWGFVKQVTLRWKVINLISVNAGDVVASLTFLVDMYWLQ